MYPKKRGTRIHSTAKLGTYGNPPAGGVFYDPRLCVFFFVFWLWSRFLCPIFFEHLYQMIQKRVTSIHSTAERCTLGNPPTHTFLYPVLLEHLYSPFLRRRNSKMRLETRNGLIRMQKGILDGQHRSLFTRLI